MDQDSPDSRLQRFELLHRIGLALASEHDRDRLVETILLEAKHLCNADGGTLYLANKDELEFVMLHSDSLGLRQGGTTGNAVGLKPIPLFVEQRPNRRNIAACAFHERKVIHVADTYAPSPFDLTGAHEFDEQTGYRTVSILAIPLISAQNSVHGVLQLINARNNASEPIPFHAELLRTVSALAAQAGIALENQALLDAQRELLESFIKLIAEAIDAKSPYTGGHCERVPVLAEMIVRSLCDATEGPFKDFQLTGDEWRELRVAAWLHDCGKVTTPVHVMDKATKLETIFDRIAIVKARFEVLRREAELTCLRAILGGRPAAEAERERDQLLATLTDEQAFLERVNIGGEFLGESDRARVREIGQRTFTSGGKPQPLLDENEMANLSISRGTLTDEERLIINGHMVQTQRMLKKLPFPRDLERVPEYAGGHHERMDGKGYPRGVFGGDMSIPARALAIADVFEALTAADRPYKKGKTLSESMAIMAAMKEHNHLDPDLLDHFVTSEVYRKYAERFMAPTQIDEVDPASVLAKKPRPFELPEERLRKERWRDFLPEYLKLFPEPNDVGPSD
jgi:HD-GYP domain-containing protein (c-di-GMP phosphodiesterase class II)